MGSMGVVYWILLPLVAAAIGWITNFIAVRMIFRPHAAIGFGPFKIQGLLPKRRQEFAESIGATVQEHLIAVEDIKRIVDDPRVKEKVAANVGARIDTFIETKLVALNPMIGAFLRGPMVAAIRDALVTEVGVLFSEAALMLGDHLDREFDMKKIVEDKILGFDMRKLEEIVLRVAKKELAAIEILGAILGFLVGCIQLLILHLIS
jgi:uncharacterized membrane protein YheB (UPF0754 family)